MSQRKRKKIHYFEGNENADIKIAVLDLGVKKNILRCFSERNVYMKVFPAKTSFSEMKAWNPNGFFISNGPGDPSVMDYAINTVKVSLNTGNFVQNTHFALYGIKRAGA